MLPLATASEGFPHNGVVSTTIHPSPTPITTTFNSTLSRHLGRRLVQIGATDVFSVPGDFNLALLIAEPGLNLVGYCNELNAGYAADRYALSRGVGACVVTFTVGGLSVLNAIAGAYSENLPVICICGGLNSNDYGTNRILHHTIGLPNFTQELRCFRTVTCYQVYLGFAVATIGQCQDLALPCNYRVSNMVVAPSRPFQYHDQASNGSTFGPVKSTGVKLNVWSGTLHHFQIFGESQSIPLLATLTKIWVCALNHLILSSVLKLVVVVIEVSGCLFL